MVLKLCWEICLVQSCDDACIKASTHNSVSMKGQIPLRPASVLEEFSGFYEEINKKLFILQSRN